MWILSQIKLKSFPESAIENSSYCMLSIGQCPSQCCGLGVYKTKTEDRRLKNEDPNFFMPDKAQTGKKPSQSVPQRKQMRK